MKLRSVLMALGLIFFLCSYSFSQVPQMINYQGKLTKASGAPLDTTVQMIFSIYADSSGATLKWTETQGAVKVEKGIFNVLLGSVNSIPDTVFNGSVRYLGVKVGGDPEIIPRKPMVSVPYAYRSGSVSQAMPVGTILIYAGSTPPSGWLLCDGVSYSATSYPELFAVIGYTYGGSGDSFYVPDMQGRGPMGYTDSDPAFNSLGYKNGEKNHTLTTSEMPIHNHSVSDPGHNHNVNDFGHNHNILDPGHNHYIDLDNNLGGGGIDDAGESSSGSTSTGYSSTGISIQGNSTGISIISKITGINILSTGSGQSHNNLQPYIVLNYIIKY